MPADPSQKEPTLGFGSPVVDRLVADRPRSLDEAWQRIETLAAAVRKAESDLSTFVYKVSHDLKAPLRAIRTYAEFLIEDHADAVSGEARQWLERLQVNADVVSEQLLGLLELSRIGRWCKPWERVDLGQVARQVRDQNQARLEVRDLALTIDADLPVVEGERQRLHQLIEILVDNAIVYRREGEGGRIEVAPLTGDDDGGRTGGFVVRDDGVGIEPRNRDRVFWVFERLQPRDYPGIGMGLALARRIVEYHGGRIWIDAGPDGGTAVHVVLPVGDAAGSARHATEASGAGGSDTDV